jgi:MFS transporter, PPP family, 3-phenylpropionic acid transporter
LICLKLQYFLAFAVIGSLLPVFTVFLSDRGLSRSEIGWVMAMTSVASLITPVMAGFLADARVDPRRLMMQVFLVAAVPLLALYYTTPIFWVVVFTAIHYLAMAPITSLQDGMNFSVQRAREEAGQPPVPYQKIRIWGSVGFMIPSVILFFLLAWGTSTGVILFIAAGFCALGVYNAWGLPKECGRVNLAKAQAGVKQKVPTMAALAMLKHRDVQVMFVAMALTHIAATGYYSYYPIYLAESAHIEKKWIGLISQVGVAVEIGFMLGLPWLIKWMGLRRLLAIGVFSLAVRLVLIGTFVSPWVAVGTQLFHGVNVLVFHVLPQVYLNQRAGDTYRISMQAVFTMIVAGACRIVGNVVMGALAQRSLELAFYVSAGLTVVAAGLLFWLFVEVKDGQEGARV